MVARKVMLSVLREVSHTDKRTTLILYVLVKCPVQNTKHSILYILEYFKDADR